MTLRLLCRLSPLLFAGTAPAQAQLQILPGADPGVIQQREIEREQQIRSEERRRDRIDQPLKPVVPPAPPAASAADAVQFFVREIRFDPTSALLEAAELEALAAEYRNRTLRLGELRVLVDRINERYRARGVVTAQASLPPQDVTGGVVTIRLVEGRVGRLRIEGNTSTREDYVADRLSLKPRDLVDLPRLEQDLVRFNRSNDAQLRAELVPGTNLGQTDIALTVAEPGRNDLRVFSDNLGSESTGSARVGVAYLRRSLTGRRDDLYLSAVRAKGHQGSYVTYTAPVTTWGTRLTAGYFKDETEIVNGPIAVLNVTGAATAYSLQLRHPLLVSSSMQLDALASYKKRNTSNEVSGTPLSEADLSGATLGLELQTLDTSGAWNLSGEVASGVNRPVNADSSDYTLARGAIRRNHRWSAGVSLVGAVSWQYASLKQLPASEQLVIGGAGSVRGFIPGLFSGDRGYVINLEAHQQIDLPADSAWKGSAFVFYDRGEVRPFRPPNNPRGEDTLTSVGFGVNLAYADRVSVRFVLGAPINKPPEADRSYRGQIQLNWQLL